MNDCKKCGKSLFNPKKTPTGLCNVCFNNGRRGENNPSWKGDLVSYGALHRWVGKQVPRPPVCPNCLIGFPIDLANLSQEYRRDLNDWRWLCRKCHMRQDGRNGKGWVTKKRSRSPLLEGVSLENKIKYQRRIKGTIHLSVEK